jgi:hypothetical protein
MFTKSFSMKSISFFSISFRPDLRAIFRIPLQYYFPSGSKMTGHGGARIGWGLVKDKRVADLMQQYITAQTLGVSNDGQIRMLGLIRHLNWELGHGGGNGRVDAKSEAEVGELVKGANQIEQQAVEKTSQDLSQILKDNSNETLPLAHRTANHDLPGMFGYVSNLFKKNWARLDKVFDKYQNQHPRYKWWNRKQHGAYMWVQCLDLAGKRGKLDPKRTCVEDIAEKCNVVGTSGVPYGADASFVRFQLLAPTVEIEMLAERLDYLLSLPGGNDDETSSSPNNVLQTAANYSNWEVGFPNFPVKEGTTFRWQHRANEKVYNVRNADEQGQFSVLWI